MRRRFYHIATMAALLLGVMPAWAYDWVVVAKVVVLESSFMPGSVGLLIDQNAGPCTAGVHFLTWVPPGATTQERIASAQAVYSALLSAQAAGTSVALYGFNNCTLQFVWHL